MFLDILHLCAGFAVILGSTYLCAMRSHWLLLSIAALLLTQL